VHSLPSLLRGAFSFPALLIPSYRAYLKRFFRNVDLIIAPSPFAAQELAPLAGGRPVRAVSSGVDLDRFFYDPEKRRAFRARYGLDRPTVLSVGQVIPLKGVEDFLSLARRFPQFQFVWAGPRLNPLLYFSPRFERSIRHRPENARFLGYIPEVEAAYSGSDLFLHPSYGESLGLVVLEAAAVGLPLVVRDLPVYRGWLEEGPRIRKCRSRDDFARAIEELLSHPAPVARRPFVEEHSLPRVGAALVSAYREVIS